MEKKKHKIAINYKNVLSLKFAFRSVKMELCCTVIYAFPQCHNCFLTYFHLT